MKTKICALCGKNFRINITINDKIVNLQNRKYCLDCSPYKQHNTVTLEKYPPCNNKTKKTCSNCKKEKDIKNDFFTRKRRSDSSQRVPISWCKSCLKEQTRNRQRRLKIAAVKYLGGKCLDCGYSGNPAAFDFHHRDPNQKETGFGSSVSSIEKIKPELDKCDLLCSNCHRIRHINTEAPTKIPPKPPKPPKPNTINKCSCGKRIGKKSKSCNSCEARTRKRTFKINWPKTEELQKILKSSNYSEVGRQLGVSDNAIRKRIKNHSS